MTDQKFMRIIRMCAVIGVALVVAAYITYFYVMVVEVL